MELFRDETLNSVQGALEELIGDLIDFLERTPDMSELSINPSGELHAQSGGAWKETHKIFSVSDRWNILRSVAGLSGQEVTEDRPSLSGFITLLGRKCRFEGLIPPAVVSPTFTIRIPPARVVTLEELFKEHRAMTQKQYEFLVEAVYGRKNVIVAGGTSSGKTTLLRALLNLLKHERIVTVEDNPELTLATPNNVMMYTTPYFDWEKAVQKCLRLAPDRIAFGEVRNGFAAYNFCIAGTSGHPGSMTTIHTDSAEETPGRFAAYVRQTFPGEPDVYTINNALDVIVHIAKIREKGRDVRRVTAIQEGVS